MTPLTISTAHCAFSEPRHRSLASSSSRGHSKNRASLTRKSPRMRCAVSSKDVGRARFGVENDNGSHTDLEVLINLPKQITPAIIGRANLDDEIGWEGKVSCRNGTFRQALVAVERDVGTANRIRVALGDDAGIVAENLAQVVFLDIPIQDPDHLHTNLTVSWLWRGHRDDPSSNELLRVAGIRSTAEFLGGEQGLGGGHGRASWKTRKTRQLDSLRNAVYDQRDEDPSI